MGSGDEYRVEYGVWSGWGNRRSRVRMEGIRFVEQSGAPLMAVSDNQAVCGRKLVVPHLASISGVIHKRWHTQLRRARVGPTDPMPR